MTITHILSILAPTAARTFGEGALLQHPEEEGKFRVCAAHKNLMILHTHDTTAFAIANVDAKNSSWQLITEAQALAIHAEAPLMAGASIIPDGMEENPYEPMRRHQQKFLTAQFRVDGKALRQRRGDYTMPTHDKRFMSLTMDTETQQFTHFTQPAISR